MNAKQPNLVTRDDTFLGVCEALGEDLGINSNLLRVALALLLFWNPVAVIVGYTAVGLLVALTRWIAPNPRRAAPQAEPAAAEAEPEPDVALAA